MPLEALGSRPTRRKPESPGAERSPDGPEARAASQATPRTPANIPMVVTCSSELYVLSPAAAPDRPTVTLQLGLVVNGLFKRRQWVYVQTPHSQEGYLAYSACTALGVLPRRAAASPWDWQRAGEPLPPAPLPGAAVRGRSWSPQRSPSEAAEPHPNRTDTEKLYENVTSDGRALGLLVQQHVRQQRGQQRARRGHLSPQTRHVSSAFRRLQSVQVAPSRSRLLAPPSGRMVAPRTNNKAVIWDGFTSFGRNTLTVRRGDIVILLNTSVGDWFWVKDADGREGYIPAICVGSGLT
ncbi:SH3 domain-containing protein Dlish [Amphibalanus amphitrite]|uniref:SH3 domain-containing protein Dlish n=1 Tax=Amphibalanus amphitrite TaxID=1232801 RepID=A0A6A4VH81_AMPAM|nr:SH3 domain-containing protein Dlish [Amphibalanus amphitrite]